LHRLLGELKPVTDPDGTPFVRAQASESGELSWQVERAALPNRAPIVAKTRINDGRQALFRS
jgi:hypothetical protein